MQHSYLTLLVCVASYVLSFFDFERERYLNCFLLECLVAFFPCLDLELLLDGTLEDKLLFVALSANDFVGAKTNIFKEFLFILLLTFWVQIAYDC